MAPRRPRRQTLRRSVEEAMRQRLSGSPAAGEAPRNGELFPEDLDTAIDRALSKLGSAPPRAERG